MHQHPRPSPVTASPASSPRTNPSRTNNQREEGMISQPRTGPELPGYNDGDEGSGDSGVLAENSPSKDSVKKIDQIIQNFHTKAAILVLQSRVSLPVVIQKDGTKRVNKWFSIETDDTSSYREDMNLWKNCGAFQNRPPTMIIETYLDTSALTNNQSLVILDEQGRSLDVLNALDNANGLSDNERRSRKRNPDVTIERWTFELKTPAGDTPRDFGSMLPTVYKKCIVFFRSLYATAKFVPGWRFVKGLAKGGSPLKVNCRILIGGAQPSRFDALTCPLYESAASVTTNYILGTTETPAGQLSAEVCYRNDCNFSVDDSESLLSSRFMGADEHLFQPSLKSTGDTRRQTIEVGSLPVHRKSYGVPEPIQAYGSMSTFHGDVPVGGSSPISALRAAKTMGSDTSSPPSDSLPRARPMQTSRASLRSLEGITSARRPSFQPFKAGSLSSSPGRMASILHPADMLPPQSPQSLPRTSGISALAQARNRSSLTAGMPASLRGGPLIPAENIVSSSTSSSPKPAPISRYSSSFQHRRGKSSFGGTGKATDDDQGSSGKQSLSSSSAQPGSGILAEGGGSSGSLQTDDDNISEFLKLLDSKKTLQSFQPSGEASASAKRTSAQLSKFQSMKEPNNLLTESMTSSMLLHRSSSSPSRRLSSVPLMVAATSMSTSSSPGKPISPHTPHTPAIPSRLGAHSIVEYSAPRRVNRYSRATTEDHLEDVRGDDQTSETGTNAIDIPTSPRPHYPHARRSSSVAQQHRALAVDDDLGELSFGVHRSISLGANDREPPSLNALRGLGQIASAALPSSPSPTRHLQPAPHISESSTAMSRQGSSSIEANETDSLQAQRGASLEAANPPYRPRLGPAGGRSIISPQSGSYSSLTERASGSGTSERAARRYSFTRNPGTYDVDDDLLFAMSELGRDNPRRSTEDPRGGGSVGLSTGERGGYDGGRGSDSGCSSRRGSRRGFAERHL